MLARVLVPAKSKGERAAHQVKMSGFGGDLVVVLKWGIVECFADNEEARANIRSLIIHLPEASDEEIASLLSKPVALVAQVRQELASEKG